MSHKSYQPVHPCGNKLLQKKWDDTYYTEHRKMVQAAKPMVDTKAPKKHPHITAKWKKQQVERERADEIERDNLTLLSKMQRIMQTQGSVDHRNTYQHHHSLNELRRQREMERVAKENKAMLQRLQKVEPQYKVSEWIDDWQRREELTGMITTYPARLPSSKPKSRTLPPVPVSSAAKGAKLAKTALPTTHAAMKTDGKDTQQETQQEKEGGDTPTVAGETVPHLQEESPGEQETGTTDGSGKEHTITPQVESDEAEKKEGVSVAAGSGDRDHSGGEPDKTENTTKAKTEE